MANPVTPEKCVSPNLDALSRGVAEEMVRLARAAIDERGHFTLVLAGGGTPRKLYQVLAQSYGEQIPWSRVHLFFGDERCVPPDHPQSNFAMAFQTLISKIRIPSQNINRIPAEMEPTEKAADAYEEVLWQFFRPSGKEGSSFSFDLILLGMGKDGHTASLFPGDRASQEDHRWVVAVNAPPNTQPRQRITLTLSVINKARQVFFLVSGDEKRGVVRSILETPEKAYKLYPAARVRPRERLLWFLDHAAYPQCGEGVEYKT